MSPDRVEPTIHEIRRVALEMFATRGYDSTSIREVANAVGIRGASMYHHFRSKEEILWDLTDTALEELHSSWTEARDALTTHDPIDALRAFVGANVRFHAERRTAASLVNAQLNRLNAEHYDLAVARRAAYEHELTRLVQECLDTGRHSVVDLRVTVFAILQMTNAVSAWFHPEGPLTVDELVAAYQSLAVKLLA